MYYSTCIFIFEKKNTAHAQDVNISIAKYSLHHPYTCEHVYQELSCFVTTLICLLTVGKIAVDKHGCVKHIL